MRAMVRVAMGSLLCVCQDPGASADEADVAAVVEAHLDLLAAALGAGPPDPLVVLGQLAEVREAGRLDAAAGLALGEAVGAGLERPDPGALVHPDRGLAALGAAGRRRRA